MTQVEPIWCGNLVAHPATPPTGVESIDVTLSPGLLIFTITGRVPKIPPPASATRTDGLWQTTCFEMFVKPIGAADYYEFNFSPSTAWAAYRFDDYRSGMRDHPFDPPRIEPVEGGTRASFSAEILRQHARVALSAVIEETDGTKSYWALRHPPGAPDFHHPDCFALELPALASP